MNYMTKPVAVRAVQYHEPYEGNAALDTVRGWLRECYPDEDERRYLGVQDSNGKPMPLLNLEEEDGCPFTVPVNSGDWLVFNPALHIVVCMSDAQFHEAYAPAPKPVSDAAIGAYLELVHEEARQLMEAREGDPDYGKGDTDYDDACVEHEMTEILDERVHEAKAEEAAAINNEGFGAQVRYLLGG